jgi:hypothetical protein
VICEDENENEDVASNNVTDEARISIKKITPKRVFTKNKTQSHMRS